MVYKKLAKEYRLKGSFEQRKAMSCLKDLLCLICIAVAGFALLAQPAVAQAANTTLPISYPALQGEGNQTCSSKELRNNVYIGTRSLLQESVAPLLQTVRQNFICGGSPGWRRIAYLNMSNPSQHCPSVWQEIPFNRQRVCGKRSSAPSCEGVNYTTGSEQYSQVCGRIIAYQSGVPRAFRGSALSINTFYVDGVSVTHGSPRQHVWTFAAGFDEMSYHPYRYPTTAPCPCVTGSTNADNIPSFVGQSYFCETGLHMYTGGNIFWSYGDALWDGQGCGPTSACCTFNSPPWFTVQLPSPTTDYIEVRICGDSGNYGQHAENTPIQLMELYVK